MSDVIRILIEYRQAFLNGALVTISLSMIVWLIGLVGGAVVGWLGHRQPRTVGAVIGGLSFLSASIPIIVMLFWAHYPLQAILGIVIDPFITTCYVLGFVNVLSIATIFRDALDQFPQQYISAAKVTGLARKDTIVHIVFPILTRQTFPSILNCLVIALQSTLFASMISVEEILRISQRINAIEYRPIEIFTALAIFFIAICVPLNGAALFLRKRFNRNFSER